MGEYVGASLGGTVLHLDKLIQTHQWTAGAPFLSQQSPTVGDSVPAAW